MVKHFVQSGKLYTFLILVVLLLAACQPVMPVEPAAEAPAAEAPAAEAPAEAPTVAVSSNELFGDFLVDGNGMTLYLFLNDEPGVTNCYDNCAVNWPPLLTTGDAIAGEGIDASLLGTTERTDGTTQVTYNGWPLYYWKDDAQPGDATGQDRGDVWYVLSPAGEMIDAVPTTVAVSEHEMLGPILVDGDGMTLYLFLNDEPGVTNCYDNCAVNWPPLLANGETVAGEGVDASLLGTTERTDGTTQVTYNGWPLYYWKDDVEPGDATGQTRGDVWFVLSPAGEMIETALEAEAAEEAAAEEPAEETTGAGLMVGSTDELGSFLVDGNGMTLYIFLNDEPGVTNCYDNCAVNWPPLMAEGEVAAGEGVDASLISTTERTDGGAQVTYNGWPLYYWKDDAQSGDTTGQAVGDVWYVISPEGEVIQ
jgi:predicted lipoprotein with Yx(FWY)xxD motif